MLGDEELDLLDESLRTFLERSNNHHQGFQQIIGQFRLLLDSYKRLKRKYHEERDGNPTLEQQTTNFEWTTSAIVPPDPKICRYYRKGNCRYGDKCSDIHTFNQSPGSSMYNFSTSSSNHSNNRSTIRDEAYYATELPLPNPRMRDAIPVNKNGERIDTYLPRPTQHEWEAYTRHSKRQKLCNKYYLTGKCGDQNCRYYHANLDFNPVDSLLYVMRQQKCRTGPQCRWLPCRFGHHCQKDGCTGRKPCLFNRHCHTLDLTVDRWEAPHGQGSMTEEEWPTSDVWPVSEPSGDASSGKSVELSMNVSLLDLNF